MSRLKPCPFCGGEPRIGSDCSGQELYFHCDKCELECPPDRKQWNTRSVPDVPELVRYLPVTKEAGVEMLKADHGDYVLHSQATEIIRYMIPRVNNCGRYIAERNDGTLMYLNHGNTWQGCDNFIAAKDKEIERLRKKLRQEFQLGLTTLERAEAAEAKLAQYEAQKPIGYLLGGKLVYGYEGRSLNDLRSRGTPLYASPAPAADMKAENERLREALKKIHAKLEVDRTGMIEGLKNIINVALGDTNA